MSRTPNICGATRAVSASTYDVYETAAIRGPRALNGPLFAAKGLLYDALDVSQCFRVYVHRGWAPSTYWVALQHANSHWSSWPCIVHSNDLRRALEAWDPQQRIRWASQAENVMWDWPKLRHYGSKGFKPRNTVTYAKGLCLAVAKQGEQFIVLIRTYPHTLNAMNFAHEADRVELLSCRPLDSLDVLKEFADTLGPKYAQAVPETLFTPSNPNDFLDRLGRFFCAWSGPELLKTHPNNVVLPRRDEGSTAAQDRNEDHELEAMKTRLKLAQAEEDIEEEPPPEDET